MLGQAVNFILIILKVIILIIVTLYFIVKKITPKFAFLRRISKIKFVKFLHKTLPSSKPKLNLVFDLDGTLIKTN